MMSHSDVYCAQTNRTAINGRPGTIANKAIRCPVYSRKCESVWRGIDGGGGHLRLYTGRRIALLAEVPGPSASRVTKNTHMAMADYRSDQG